MNLQFTPKGILLDLDDTLYPEREYFLSGLAAVASRLEDWESGKDHMANLTVDLEQNGRQGILDRTIPSTGVTEEDAIAWRQSLLHAYRNHMPDISMFDDVAPFLKTCREHRCRLGLVTDGKSCVQWRKVLALNLDQLLDAIVITDDIDSPKPSPKPFQVAAQLLQLRAEDCIYIGDDASKDFIGPRENNMRTIQLHRKLNWPIGKPALNPEAEADYHANGLLDASCFLFRKNI